MILDKDDKYFKKHLASVQKNKKKSAPKDKASLVRGAFADWITSADSGILDVMLKSKEILK